MNAPAQISRKGTEDPWSVATNAVNAWRGACLHVLTQAENAVTECLIRLRGAGYAVPLRPLMGHRFADLTALVGPEGDLAAHGSQVAAALEAFRGHEDLRADLAHGFSSIALKRSLLWIAIFQRISVRKGQPERTEHVYDEMEAARRLQELKSSAQGLCTALQVLEQTLGSAR